MATEKLHIATAAGAVSIAATLLADLAERAEAGYRKLAWGGVEPGGIRLASFAKATADNPCLPSTDAGAVSAGPVDNGRAVNSGFYPSVQHREALAVLERGIRSRRGINLLVGEAGTGKTAVLGALQERLAESHACFSLLKNPRLGVDELFELLAYDLKLAAVHTRKVAVLYALQQRAAQLAGGGQTLAILFDDAHLLSRELLLEIELLQNIETRWGKLLQVVLSGRPELHELLARPEPIGLRQRVSLQARVSPFDGEDTRGYALHRLGLNGLTAEQHWEPGFTAELFRLTHGLPRTIDALCTAVSEEAERRGEARWSCQLLREVAG